MKTRLMPMIQQAFGTPLTSQILRSENFRRSWFLWSILLLESIIQMAINKIKMEWSFMAGMNIMTNGFLCTHQELLNSIRTQVKVWTTWLQMLRIRTRQPKLLMINQIIKPLMTNLIILFLRLAMSKYLLSKDHSAVLI